MLATLLVIVGPLVSRWQRDDMDPGLTGTRATQVAPPTSEAMPDNGGSHHHHQTAGAMPAASMAAKAKSPQPPDPHAGHDMGVDCDYCLLAARLLPWMVFALLILPLLRAPAPRVFKVLGRVGKAWHGHLGARGPPRGRALTLSC